MFPLMWPLISFINMLAARTALFPDAFKFAWSFIGGKSSAFQMIIDTFSDSENKLVCFASKFASVHVKFVSKLLTRIEEPEVDFKVRKAAVKEAILTLVSNTEPTESDLAVFYTFIEKYPDLITSDALIMKTLVACFILSNQRVCGYFAETWVPHLLIDTTNPTLHLAYSSFSVFLGDTECTVPEEMIEPFKSMIHEFKAFYEALAGLRQSRRLILEVLAEIDNKPTEQMHQISAYLDQASKLSSSFKILNYEIYCDISVYCWDILELVPPPP